MFIASAAAQSHDLQTWDLLEVADVGRSQPVAEFQGARPDRQIRSRNADATRLAPAIDLFGAGGLD
jgi:hypothetical protein